MTRTFEGVEYYRYRVRFRLADGRVVRWTRWSPGWSWVANEVLREIQDRYQPSALKPRSLTVRLSP